MLSRAARWRWSPHLGLTIGAALLFSLGLATHPVGRDEAVSILAARHPVGELLDLVVHHEPHPAGYYLALSLWPHDTLVEARLFSFLPALLCVPLVVSIARRLQLPVWAAGILASTSPFLGFYSVEARMYSWLALVGALALFVAVLVTDSNRETLKPAVLAGLVMALAAYVHYFGFFLGLSVVLWLLLKGRRRQAAAAILSAAVAYLPGLLMLTRQVAVFRRYPTGTWQAREDPAHVFETFSVLLAGAEFYLPAFAVTAVFLAVIGWALVRGRSRPGVRLPAFWLLPTLALPLAIGAVIPLDSPRYLAAAFPALVLLLAAATAEVPPRAAIALTSVLALLGVGLVLDSTRRQDNTKPPLPAVLALAGPGRLIVVQNLLLAPEVAFYVTSAPVAYDFKPPAVDRVGYWALAPGAAYPPSPPQPLLIVSYCDRLRPPPPGYTVERTVRLDLNLCGELATPPGG